MDELARALGMDPFELRQRNVVKPGDAMVSGEEASDADELRDSTSASTSCAAPWRAGTACRPWTEMTG